MRVLYIMGAGHIGSTVFDVVLGLHGSLASAGELTKLHRPGWTPDAEQRCSCGALVVDCDYWRRVRQLWTDASGSGDVERYVRLQKRFERSRSGWLRLIAGSRRPSDDFKEYLRSTGELYRAIRTVSGQPVVVDSSLSPRRAYALSRNPAIDLSLIHFLRDGRGCLWSLTKRARRLGRAEPSPLSVARYWVSANLQSAWVMRGVPADRRARVRYEDFVTNPADTMDVVGSIIGENLSGVGAMVDGGRSVTVDNHMAGGNRVRLERQVHLRADFSWARELPEKWDSTYWRTAGWLATRYGYARHVEG